MPESFDTLSIAWLVTGGVAILFSIIFVGFKRIRTGSALMALALLSLAAHFIRQDQFNFGTVCMLSSVLVHLWIAFGGLNRWTQRIMGSQKEGA